MGYIFAFSMQLFRALKIAELKKIVNSFGGSILPKTPSFILGQRCPENLEISIIEDVQFSNFDNSEVAKDINELLSYSENVLF